MSVAHRSLLVLVVLALAACGKDRGKEAGNAAAAQADEPESPATSYDQIDRAAFNVNATLEYLPLFWIDDQETPGTLTPDELAVLWGYGEDHRSRWVKDGEFTPEMAAAYKSIVNSGNNDKSVAKEDDEQKRRELVKQEIRQGRPTLVLTDLSEGTDEDRAVAEHILAAATHIERIFAKQVGSYGLDKDIPADDRASRMLFFRNQGPWCEAPLTEKEELCHALPNKPARVSGLYPKQLAEADDLCAQLEKHKDADKLLGHFNTVQEKDGKLVAVPYPEAYPEEMQAVKKELEAAAAAIESEDEAAFKAYLLATAKAFETNDWEPANKAWVAMNATNSKWYLRIGPDEVYFEPCARKAGFHVSFARINKDSLAWQEKLDPIKQDMETELAKLAGKPYKKRKVAFKLPDFIDIVVNAGDARSNLGATIGQSLPNWGAVAEAGGRTVAMTNLYTDPDSIASYKDQVGSVLCKETMAKGDWDQIDVMGTVLHEAAHNLGPSHDYKVRGKTDDKAFGGPLASMLEELKAQTSSLYLIDFLQKKGVLEEKEANQALLRNIVWAFGHISTGMYTGDGRPKAYSQLAAIQIGYLLEKGAMVWNPEQPAANGEPKGCFSTTDKLRPTIKELEKTVLQIKARGDKKKAEALKKKYVDDEGEWSKLREVIRERWLKAPKASFVYAVKK